MSVSAMKMEVPEHRLLDVGKVKSAKYNPAKRVMSAKLKSLVKSINRIGLIYPIIVDKEHRIIDGHRRLAAVMELGWEAIPAIIVERTDRDEVYADVNATSAKMNGNETLGIWLANPKAVGETASKTIAEMEKVLSRKLLARVYEAGLSSRVYLTAKRVAKYVGQETQEMVQQAVEWLMETAIIGQVMKAMEGGVSSRRLLSAVKENKPLLLARSDD